MSHPWPNEGKHPYKWRPPAEVQYFTDAPKATSAVAGTPGTWTPAGNGGVNTFAGMSTIGASPGSAWTTGQRMLLNDGTEAYFNGSTWVAGRAP